MRVLGFIVLCYVCLAYAYDDNSNLLVVAEQQNSSESQTKDSNLQVAKATTSIKEKAKTAATTLLTGFSAKGFIFGRNFFITGPHGSGASWQFRAKIDITTGKVNGYSLTGGIIFAQGSSGIDKGRVTYGDVQGSRGVAFNENFSDRFNVSQIYGSKEFSLDSLGAKIDVGRMNLVTPLSDKNLDVGLGFRAKFEHKLDSNKKFGYELSFYDSWLSDLANYNIRRREPKRSNNDSLSDSRAAGVGIGNNLSMIHVWGKDIVGLDFNAVYANIFRMFDAIVLGDVSYKLKFGEQQLGFLAQTSFAALNASPHAFIGLRGTPITTRFEEEFYKFSARYRGIYNLQVNYKLYGLSAKVGFLGSFSQGYGTLLTRKGIINMAGSVWHTNMTATYEGLGLFGSGSFRGTSIGVLYAAASYKFPFKLQVGLDVAYLLGNNHFPVLNVTNPKRPLISYSTIVDRNRKFIDAKFVEITPQIKYEFLKNLNFIFLCAIFAGDIQLLKTHAEVRYVF